MGPVGLGVALARFVAFHFHPAFEWEQGWQFWADAFDIVMDRQQALTIPMGPTLAIFATFSAGVVFSPFAAPLIRKSLLARWFVAFISGLVCLALFFGLLVVGPSRMHAGGIYVLLSAACNFVGIVMIRYEGRHQERLRKLSGY